MNIYVSHEFGELVTSVDLASDAQSFDRPMLCDRSDPSMHVRGLHRPTYLTQLKKKGENTIMKIKSNVKSGNAVWGA